MNQVFFRPEVSSRLTLHDAWLVTKLWLPKTRPAQHLVSRPRLFDRLNQGLSCRLTLVSAPAGFGKTTVLSDWLQQIGDQGLGVADEGAGVKVAWLSLDQKDNDLRRFLSYLIAALQRVQPGLSEAALYALTAPQPFSAETILITMINEISAVPGWIVFVLDDYHLIEAQPVHEALMFLLDHLPPQVHLVIASRTQPPLPLARLRVQNQLVELTTADLRFTPDEAAIFLNRIMGLHLSARDVAVLEGRTEGWIAGLQLAALSMQGRDDVSGFIAAFTGSHRYVLDYLVEEVLQRQPEPIQTFLLKTSILNRLTGSLCEAVAGQPGGQATLAGLEEANLFLVPLDDERRWYRYHHLFADLLRHRLQYFPLPGGEPSNVAELHRRASEWYEQQGLIAEAMGHALSAADIARAVRLVEPAARTMLSRSEMATLLSWLDVLPEELDRSQPHLSLFHTWALVLTGHLDLVETIEPDLDPQALNRANVTWANLPGEMDAIRATAAYFRRDFAHAARLTGQALASLAEDNLFLRAALALNLGIAHSWLGNVIPAGQAFGQASDLSQRAGNLHVTLVATWNQGQVELERGQLHRAADLYRQALKLVNQQQHEERSLSPAAGGAYVGLGCLLYERNELAEAEAQLLHGIELSEPGAEIGIATIGRLVLARVKLAYGDAAGAMSVVQQAYRLASQHNDLYWTAQTAAQQAWLWTTQARVGNDHHALRNALDWALKTGLNESGEPVYLHEFEYLVLARLLIEQGRQQADRSVLERAAGLLARLYQATEAAGRLGRTVEVLLLQALVFQALSRPEQALAILEQALSLARPEGYKRLFIDEGGVMETLLRRVASRGIELDYVNKVLEAFGMSDSGWRAIDHRSGEILLVEALSERELEILHLVAAGLSNGEIARDLALTTGTVKWHLNNIYGKLNVRSRTQAVAQARLLKLL